jgi:alkanesulfonate monooxygenase SsuD/methylene tetrahydromethanopterin reductase-like flavin-dependent oxidoreductase (luciferase family)
MKYGAYFSSVGEFSSASLLASLAYEAEESGWDGAFIWDHIAQPHAAADPWVAMAAMAVNTKRITLGPIITPIARRRPWKLARETVTLDHLCNGRLILGAGLGWSNVEFDTFGEDGSLQKLAERLDEGLDVLVGLWSGETFNYNGQHYRIKDALFLPRPFQSPRIPIWICGGWPNKKAPFRRAAQWDGILAICTEDRAISPEEITDIKRYIASHRISQESFDIVVILWSDGIHNQEEHNEVERYENAGVTWWLEDLSMERFQTINDARTRLHKGPPGIKSISGPTRV